MAKSETTLALEEAIYRATFKQGVFGCFEVTIGWFGAERVDYITYDTKGIWLCYEVKASIGDFHSKAAKTFLGHFNYFVMPQVVFDSVRKEIPKGIGVYIYGTSVLRATRRDLGIDENILKDSLIRSLAREYQTNRRSENRDYLARLSHQITEEKSSRAYAENRYREILNAGIEKYGNEFSRVIREYRKRNDSDVG